MLGDYNARLAAAISRAHAEGMEQAARIADDSGGKWGNDLSDAFNDGCHFAAKAIRAAVNAQSKEP